MSQTGKHLLRTQNVSEQNQKHFLSRHKICVRNKCWARGQTRKHLCGQQCVRNSVSSLAPFLLFVVIITEHPKYLERELKFGYCLSHQLFSWTFPQSYKCYSGELRPCKRHTLSSTLTKQESNLQTWKHVEYFYFYPTFRACQTCMVSTGKILETSLPIIETEARNAW